MATSNHEFDPDGPLPIAAVERETGLSKDVLRKWEVRYGFPAPERDTAGERLYPAEQVERLRLIKRLLDRGMRPSRVVGQAPSVLAGLAERQQGAVAGVADEFEEDFLRALRGHDIHMLRRRLIRLMHREGLRPFVQDRLAGLIQRVGIAWARGEIDIHDEHLFSEVVQGVLRGIVDELNDTGGRPRILLTTLPGESHGLGLLMVSAMAALEGACCLPLGTQTPVREICSAALAREVDVVALSFSSIFPARQVTPALAQLRRGLHAEVEIWIGGEGANRSVRADGDAKRVTDLARLSATLADWRMKSA